MAHVVVGLVAAAVLSAILIPYGVGYYIASAVRAPVQAAHVCEVVDLNAYRYERWRR